MVVVCQRIRQELPVTRRHFWLAAASIFTFVNLCGVGFAAVNGEVLHTAVHVVLLLPGGYLIWRLATPDRGHELRRALATGERLEQLQQSVDAVAIEVERIGEAQRFAAKLEKERRDTSR